MCMHVYSLMGKARLGEEIGFVFTGLPAGSSWFSTAYEQVLMFYGKPGAVRKLLKILLILQLAYFLFNIIMLEETHQQTSSCI